MIRNKINSFLILFGIILILSYTISANAVSDSELESLFKTASLWQVGENKEKVATAREKLISIGEPAIAFIIENKLSNPTSLESRAIDAVLLKHPELAGPKLITKLEDEKVYKEVRINCIILLAKLKNPDPEKYILAKFHDEDYQGAVVYYIRELKLQDGESLILEVLPGLEEPRALNYLQAIGVIGGNSSVKFLINYLNSDRNILLRTAGENSLKKLTRNKPEIIISQFKNAVSFRLKYHLINIMGSNPDEKYIKILIESLNINKPVLRLNVIRNLKPYLNDHPDVRKKLESQLLIEKDPEVKAYLKKTLAI